MSAFMTQNSAKNQRVLTDWWESEELYVFWGPLKQSNSTGIGFVYSKYEHRSENWAQWVLFHKQIRLSVAPCDGGTKGMIILAMEMFANYATLLVDE